MSMQVTIRCMDDPSASQADLITAADFVRFAATRFAEAELAFGHGTDSALDEAAFLVLGALRLPYSGIPDYLWQARLTAAERTRLGELIETRVYTRKPVAYLLRETLFAGLPFYVDERVLVPRSPIAELAEEGFASFVDPAVEAPRFLDLCTGGGCIAVATAVHRPGAWVDAADVAADALEVAAVNVARYGLEDRVELIRSDLFEGLAGGTYDLIVSNPPYVDAEAMAALPAEYRAEPAQGLAGGLSGIDFALRVLADAADYLVPEGVLIVEVGDSASALERALPGVPFLWLEFERGGHGVFALYREDLLRHRPAVRDCLAAGGENSRG